MSIIEQISCRRCGNPMPKLRLTAYGYDFCVNCSDVEPKVGRIMTYGTGDHTYNELQVLNHDVAKRLDESENSTRRINPKKIIEDIDLDDGGVSVIDPPEKYIQKAIEEVDLLDDSDLYDLKI